MDAVRFHLLQFSWIWLLLLTGGMRADALETVTLKSEKVPLSVQASGLILSQKILRMAEEAIQDADRKLYGEDLKHSSIHVKWSPSSLRDVEKEDLPYTFRRNLRIRDDKKVFIIYGRGNPEALREVLLRTVVIVYLQAMALEDAEAIKGDYVPDPPFWLVEGMTQGMMEERLQDFERVVGTMTVRKRTPTLEEVQEWEGLHPDKLTAFWQQAFLYWLVEQMTSNRAEQRALKVWVRQTMMKTRLALYWTDFPEGEKWWVEVLARAPKRQVPVMTWDESFSTLRDCLQFAAPGEEGKQDVLGTVRRLPENPSPELVEAVFKNVWPELAGMELHAHFRWAPVAVLFRQAIVSWKNGDQKAYGELIQLAEKMELSNHHAREKALKRLDWFEVNHPVGSVWTDLDRFRNIFEYRPIQEEQDPVRHQLTSVLR